MRAGYIATVLALSAITAAVIGCAAMSVGPTPTDEIQEALADYQAAWKAQSVDEMIAMYSLHMGRISWDGRIVVQIAL